MKLLRKIRVKLTEIQFFDQIFQIHLKNSRKSAKIFSQPSNFYNFFQEKKKKM